MSTVQRSLPVRFMGQVSLLGYRSVHTGTFRAAASFRLAVSRLRARTA